MSAPPFVMFCQLELFAATKRRPPEREPELEPQSSTGPMRLHPLTDAERSAKVDELKSKVHDQVFEILGEYAAQITFGCGLEAFVRGLSMEDEETVDDLREVFLRGLDHVADVTLGTTFSVASAMNPSEGLHEFRNPTATKNMAFAVSYWALQVLTRVIARGAECEPSLRDREKLLRIKDIMRATCLERSDEQIAALQDLAAAAVGAAELREAAIARHGSDEKAGAWRGGDVVRSMMCHLSLARLDQKKKPGPPVRADGSESLERLAWKAVLAWKGRSKGGRPRKGEATKWELANEILAAIGIGAASADALESTWNHHAENEEDKQLARWESDYAALSEGDRQRLASHILDRCDAEVATPDLVNEAIDLANAGKLNEAESLLHEAQKGDPLEYSAPLAIAAIRIRRDDLDGAESIYREIIERQSDNLDALLGMGFVLLKLQKPTQAATYLLEAVRLYPDCAKGYLALGAAFDRSGRPEEASLAWKKCISLDPSSKYARAAEEALHKD